MVNNFHHTAFDDATLLKLEIYRRYIETWLPVFIERPHDSWWDGRINIFDFFCGPGKDADGRDGSPLVAIKECSKFATLLSQQNKNVKLVFNDARPKKIKELNETLGTLKLPLEVHFETGSNDFDKAFMRKLREMTGAANLIFIDQCGIKEVNENVFRALIGLKGTDFLFFIASSFFKRFRESKEFKRYLDTSNHLNDDTPHADSHRVIANMYREMIPGGESYFLAPFSLKKGSNIYGLIFGSSNLLGILKFLEICWNIDPERGEANFDIDDEKLPSKTGDCLDLFKDNDKSEKITRFQNMLRESLLSGMFNSDKDVFTYSLNSGFLPTRHAKEVVVELIKDGKLLCDGRPRLSKICIKDPRIIRLC